ncbi:MAG: DedA family protein [Magnetococcales bacterium]|nr:DedA family protein [Magnetococcales bacterium]NGZ25742.1 DedA family protein [Magnetococcales bacterium]
MSEAFTQFLLELMGQLDYWAIFWLMAAESTVLPVPSELVMTPAGYLASQGKLELWLVVVSSSLGSIVGSLFSYWVALLVGRPFLLRYGNYCFVKPHHLVNTESFLQKHGEISIFTGRFIPGLRHLISVPAGIGRMRLLPFTLYTLVGATLWNLILTLVGYAIGENQDWIKSHLPQFVVGGMVFALLVVGIYILFQRRKVAES